MEKTTRIEPATVQPEQDNAVDNDVRTLQDLELVLAGGGNDGAVTW